MRCHTHNIDRLAFSSSLFLFTGLHLGCRRQDRGSDLSYRLLFGGLGRARVCEQCRFSVRDEFKFRSLNGSSIFPASSVFRNPQTLSSPLTPMIAVGLKAKHAQCARGYQYQNWQNRAIPTMALVFLLPALLCRLIVTFLPPASIRPWPSAAPNLAIGSSCLSKAILVYNDRIETIEDEETSDCWTRIIPSAMNAPWRTKSTLSLVIGSRISTASWRPVPAQAIPSARVAPHRTWGL